MSIWLVGAGPGDPELLTLKAVRLLSEADLVVSDRLVPQEVLDLVSQGKVVLAQPKRGVDSSLAQNQLNETVLSAAVEGKKVVRLKQGDPMLFARGAEEILYFQSKAPQIPIHVVPGISSALSCPVAAGIPVTHRGVSDQVLVMSSVGAGGKLFPLPEYVANRTLIILMGVGRLGRLSEELLELGYPSDLPVCLSESCFTPHERVTFFRVSSVSIDFKRMDPPAKAPGVIIIGRSGSVLQQPEFPAEG